MIIVTHRGKPTLGKQLLLKYSTTLIYVMSIESETEIGKAFLFGKIISQNIFNEG